MKECVQRECQFFLDTALLDDLLDWLQENEARMVEFETWQSARRARKSGTGEHISQQPQETPFTKHIDRLIRHLHR